MHNYHFNFFENKFDWCIIYKTKAEGKTKQLSLLRNYFQRIKIPCFHLFIQFGLQTFGELQISGTLL